MSMKETVGRLESSPEFGKWKKENAHSYLADAFLVIDTKSRGEWQLGYYTGKSDKVTVFKVSDKIEISAADEVLKKEEDKVYEVKVEDIAIEMDEALRKSVEFLRVKYPKDIAIKTIMILQNLKEVLQWNITHISSSYNAINVRIDATNGNVISHTLIPLFEFASDKQ